MTAALGIAAATTPVVAQDSRSLQDMLMAAVRLGDAAAVRSLLGAGADVAKRGPNGKTAIDIAVEAGRFEIAELLVQERRRQRDAVLAQPAAPTATPEVEIDQRTAEAAPEVVIAQRPVTLPKPPVPAAPVTYVPPPSAPQSAPPPAPPVAAAPAGATVEQLLAVAQQLTQAAQALAASQRAATARETQVSLQSQASVRPYQFIDPDFLPKPGRKPEIEQASLTTSNLATSSAAAPRSSETVVVTPRRRSSAEEGAELARRNLEDGEDLPVIPSAVAPVDPAPANVVRVTPSTPRNAIQNETPEPAEPDNGLLRAVKGIGGFLGIGDAKKAETSEATQVAPSHAKPGSAREMMRRDRANVPHVPARRATESQPPATQPQQQPQARVQSTQQSALQPQAVQAPIQAGMPPVRAMPVIPVQEQPMTLSTGQSSTGKSQPATAAAAPSSQTARLTVRRSGGLNPFDPNSMPQGSVLPATDPVAGNTPEIARAQALPDPAEDKVAMAAEEASLRETLRQSALPQSARAQRSTQKPTQSVVPDVPPLPDSAKPAAPTAMFERRTQTAAAAKPADKSEDGILQNIASAVGIGSRDDEMPSDNGAGAGGAERLSSTRMPVINLRQPLANVPLTLGNSVATNQRPLPRGVAEPDPCIKRSGGSLMFCVVPVDWHPRVDPAFELTTYLYQGARAIARYDAGKATHYHTLFKSLAYDDVVKYFTAKYGQPTDEWKRTIAPFDQPRQPNPTMVWRSRDTRTNVVTILEVRRYDDTRNVFPDMEHGAVRLYTAGAQRVFPVITAMDLMGIDWAARSDHVDSPNDSALANTIRVGK